MKKIITLAFYMLMITNMFGQTNDFCQILGEAEHRTRVLSQPYVFNKDPGNPPSVDCSPRVFNVRFNVFNDESNTNFCSRNDIPFGEEQFLDYIKILNMEYNSFNIFFKYRGYHIYGGTDGNAHFADTNTYTFANPTHHIYLHFDELADLLAKDVININFVNQLNTPTDPLPTKGPGGTETIYTHSGFVGAAVIGRNQILFALPGFMGVPNTYPLNYSSVMNEKNFLLCHEMGHVLGLFHTFSDQNQYAEHVTRDTNSPLYNAESSADMIVDTPAQHNFPSQKFNESCDFIPYLPLNSNVNYFGELFDMENIDFGNIMAYNPKDLPVGTYYAHQHNDCLGWDPIDFNVNYYFTNGQKNFIRNFLNNIPPANPIFPSGINTTTLAATETSINSLFQPYSKEKIYGDIVSTTDNGNGTATVCRAYTFGNYKFQPGFDYVFPDSVFPDPSTATKYQTPIIAQPTYNFPLTILQLANCNTNGNGNIFNICRATECFIEPIIGGTKSMAPHLLSTEITTETLNADQLSDPNFIQELPNQKLYKITKETTSGATTEDVFYKQ